MSLHEDLVNEALSGKVSMGPRENALVNEIRRLQALLDPRLPEAEWGDPASSDRFIPAPAPKKSKKE